jgi:hypothetical protein
MSLFWLWVLKVGRVSHPALMFTRPTLFMSVGLRLLVCTILSRLVKIKLMIFIWRHFLNLRLSFQLLLHLLFVTSDHPTYTLELHSVQFFEQSSMRKMTLVLALNKLDGHNGTPSKKVSFNFHVSQSMGPLKDWLVHKKQILRKYSPLLHFWEIFYLMKCWYFSLYICMLIT